MVNKLKIFAGATFFCGALMQATPSVVLKNATGCQVFMYELPQQAGDDAIDRLLTELKNLPAQGVGQLLVDDISSELLAKRSSALPKLCGTQAWDEIGVPVSYLDLRVVERIALLLSSIGVVNVMDYLDDPNNLDQIYQQWGIDEKLKDNYQAQFAPLCTQIRQMMGSVANPPSQREAEQLLALYKKFEQCFVNHLYIIFKATRKALTVEHNALLQEIASYKDGEPLAAEYKKISETFKKTAPWLTDTGAEETLFNYVRRSDLLTDDEKKVVESLTKKNPAQAPAIEDINFMKIMSIGMPLIAIRAVHSIVNSKKSIALFIIDPVVRDIIKNLLSKAGYTDAGQQ